MVFLKKNKFILLLLLIIFILRLPSLFEPYWYGDEGVYLTLGLAIKKGLLLYQDIYDNKPPLIYLIATAANGTMFWFRFFLMVSVLITIFFFHQLSSKFFPQQNNSVKIATVFLALLTTIRLIEANVSNAEIFMLLPTVVGFNLVLLFFKESQNKKMIPTRYFLAGFILSFGFLLKVPAIFDLLALLIFWIIFEDQQKNINLGKREFLTLAGYSLPILLTGIFFGIKKILPLFWQSCFWQTAGYLFSWETGSHSFSLVALLRSEFSLRSLALVFIFWLFWKKRTILPKTFIFTSLWFLLSLFGASLSSRPYPHYLIQVLPSFSLLLGFLFLPKQKTSLKLAQLSLISLLFITFWHYRFWAYPTFSYWKNFVEFSLSRKNKFAYFAYFNQKIPTIYKTAEIINAHTKADDKIFIWSNEAYLYALAKRLPSTPYVVAYHIIDFNHFVDVLQIIRKDKTPLIVIDGKIRQFPELEAILEADYLKIAAENEFSTYIIKKTI